MTSPGKITYALKNRSGQVTYFPAEFDSVEDCLNDVKAKMIKMMQDGSSEWGDNKITINYKSPDEEYIDAFCIQYTRFPKQKPIDFSWLTSWFKKKER